MTIYEGVAMLLVSRNESEDHYHMSLLGKSKLAACSECHIKELFTVLGRRIIISLYKMPFKIGNKSVSIHFTFNITSTSCYIT